MQFPIIKFDKFELNKPNDNYLRSIAKNDDILFSELKQEVDLRFRSNRNIMWQLKNNDNNENYGIIGFKYIDNYHKFGIISFNFINSCSNSTINKCLSKIIDYGFKKLMLNRIESVVSKDNNRSIKILNNSLLKFEGIQKNKFKSKIGYKDLFMYIIINKNQNPNEIKQINKLNQINKKKLNQINKLNENELNENELNQNELNELNQNELNELNQNNALLKKINYKNLSYFSIVGIVGLVGLSLYMNSKKK